MHKFDPTYNNLYLDSDGVLADFDSLAAEVLGMPARDYEELYGSDDFWERLNAHGNFFGALNPLPDAQELFNAVEHLRPIILTGAPSYIPSAREQKIKWYADFLPGTVVVVCQSRKKVDFCKPGDIIVDDWPRHQKKWEGAGGTWVMHTSAADSISQLVELGVLDARV